MAGVLSLPSGRLVRGRGLCRPLPTGPLPTFALYLLGHQPPPVSWEACWLRWPDFWLPSDPVAAAVALREASARAVNERVEIACAGGRGRTGTALACLAVLDGLPGRQAIAYVRERYDSGAVETPWQRRFVSRFRHLQPSDTAQQRTAEWLRPDGRRAGATARGPATQAEPSQVSGVWGQSRGSESMARDTGNRIHAI